MKDIEKFKLEKFEKYINLIESQIVRASVNTTDLKIRENSAEHFDCPDNSGSWTDFKTGKRWGGKETWTDFRSTFTIPDDWNSDSIELRMEHQPFFTEPFLLYELEYAGPEGHVFIDSVSAGAIDREHHRIRHSFEPGKTYDIRSVFFAGRHECQHFLKNLSVALIDSSTEKFYYNLRTLLDIARLMDQASKAFYQVTEVLEQSIACIDARDIPDLSVLVKTDSSPRISNFYSSVTEAQQVLDTELSKLNSDSERPEVVAVGHAHIDLAWLWPIRHTKHKCVRTFATQCRLLKQYDNWIFNQSSPQAYKWLEENSPEVFSEVCALIKKGRWEADGAMWCEADTNITGGESLVRQLLYGKRFFQDKLGVDSRMLWLPDVFGYSGALPQLLKLAEVDSFVTSKISWSQYNRFPHDTFVWKGIDGTGVPTHFITTPCEGTWFLTYNAKMSAEDLKGAWDEYRQKSSGNDPLVSYGYGDGGGGPIEEMLERAERFNSLPPIEGFPKLKHEKAGSLMERICADKDNLPVWEGELYLEYHRGTYTSQAWLKRANRKNEINLHNLEWLLCLADSMYSCKKEKLLSMWEDLLLCHFHDIIPGSSVGEVYYDEVKTMQDQISKESQKLLTEAAEAIAENIDTSEFKNPLVLFNTLAWERTSPVKIKAGKSITGISIPAGGWVVIDADSCSNSADTNLSVSDSEDQISNQFWELGLDSDGCISSLYDKANYREVLSAGAVANQWELFEDRPMAHPAWDIDIYYQEHPIEKPAFISREITKEAGRIVVKQEWEIPAGSNTGKTSITQDLVIYDTNPRIDFETTIDWHTPNQLLKVAFPVDIRSSEATCQIQFGHLKRPTHRNTSWDLAKFEVCAQQYVDLSEYGYGVSLINDCKYGHDITDNIIRLTCIKSAQAPDPVADIGHHEFTYALLPHKGSLQEARVERVARELNTPVIAIPAKKSPGKLDSSSSFIKCDNEAVIIETLKPAEDSDDIILRMYESHGSHVQASIEFNKKLNRAEYVNLLEKTTEDQIDLKQSENSLSFSLKPFQIASIRLSFL